MQDSNLVNMLKNIDSCADRTISKICLLYDKKTLNHIISKGYVTIYGDKITRKFNDKNYEIYC